jgi:hypothetical protein
MLLRDLLADMQDFEEQLGSYALLDSRGVHILFFLDVVAMQRSDPQSYRSSE